MDNYLASSTAAFPQPNVESLRWSCCCRFFRWCGFVGAETLASPWTAFRAFPGVLLDLLGCKKKFKKLKSFSTWSLVAPWIITQSLNLTSWSHSHQYNQVHLAGEELWEPIPLNFPRVFISSMLLLFNKTIMCPLYWVLSLLSIICTNYPPSYVLCHRTQPGNLQNTQYLTVSQPGAVSSSPPRLLVSSSPCSTSQSSRQLFQKDNICRFKVLQLWPF